MSKFHSLTIADVRRETEDAVSIAFDIPEELRDDYAFRPGQHLTLRAEIGGEDVRRSYSICSGLDEGEIRVCIKRQPHGVFSGYANENLKPGMTLDVLPPAGRFILDPDAAGDKVRRYVLVAAGSGITPLISMAKSLLARDDKAEVTLIYGSRTVKSIIFRREIEALKDKYLSRFTLHHVLSREKRDNELLDGHIDGEKLLRLAGPLFDLEAVDGFYLCGPQAMIESLKSALRDAGVPEDRIHFELFATETAPAAAGSAEQAMPEGGSKVLIRADGVQTLVEMGPEDASILEAAQRAGLDLPFACKGGVCGTCRARVRKGKAAMALNYALEDDEVEKGYVLTCQARPQTETIEIDFDAP